MRVPTDVAFESDLVLLKANMEKLYKLSAKQAEEMNLLKTEIDIVKNENNSLKSELHEKFDDLKTVTENVVDVIAKSFMVKMQLQQDTFEEKTNMLLNSLEGQIANMVSVLSKSNYIASSSEASSNH